MKKQAGSDSVGLRGARLLGEKRASSLLDFSWSVNAARQQGDGMSEDATDSEIFRLLASHARLLEACRGLLAYEHVRAVYAGLADCTCITISRAGKMAYEIGECPHQVARAAIAAADGGKDG